MAAQQWRTRPGGGHPALSGSAADPGKHTSRRVGRGDVALVERRIDHPLEAAEAGRAIAGALRPDLQLRLARYSGAHAEAAHGLEGLWQVDEMIRQRLARVAI